MKKIVKNLFIFVIAGMVGLLAGCGGGEGGTASTISAPTILDGTASKGIIYPGTVTIFAVNAGVKASTPLKTVQTNVDGKFTADLGQYKGAVVIEASGTYTDEASAATVTIDAANPLRAAINDVSSVTGGKRCAVTPLTDLAFSLMAGSLTTENIVAANAHVAVIFKLADIVWTEPVRPDAASMGASGVTKEQQVYTIALATLSQMAKNKKDSGDTSAPFDLIKNILVNFKKDLAAAPTAGLVSANTDAFTAALGTVSAPTATLGVFADSSSTLQNVSRSEFKLTLSAGTLPAGTLIGGIQGTITLPPGTSVRTVGSTEEVRGGVLVAPASSMALAGYTAATRTVNYALVYGTGYSGGDFATLLIDVQTGTSVTAADFTLSGSKVIDTASNTINSAITGK